MTRQTALQFLLCFVGYPLLKAADAAVATTPNANTFLVYSMPTTLTISFEYIKEIHLLRDGKKVVVKMDDIWEALK